MAKQKEKAKRILVCVESGKSFEYVGHGRPPLYCPEVKAERLKKQRANARNKASQKRRAA